MKRRFPVKTRLGPIFSVIVLVSALLWQTGVPSAHAGPGSRTLITFEDLDVGTPVFTQYVGVTFMDGDNSTHPVAIGAPAEGTASPSHALLANTTVICEHEFHCRALRMQFDEPQSLVQFSTGLATTGGNITVLATGLDASGSIVAQAQDNSLCTALGRTAVNTPLTLAPSAPTIVEVDIAYVTCTGPGAGQPLFAAPDMPIEIDNLAFTLPLNPPPGEHDKPVFISVTPEDGATATGRYPREIFTGLSVTVHEHALRSLTAQINGGPELPLSYQRTDTDTYGGGIGLTDANGLKAGSNVIVLTATDFDHPQNTAKKTVTFTFTPQPDTATSDDIRPSAFEVTQVIDPGPQSLSAAKPITASPWDGFDIDYNSSIPLLEGKTTLVRIYGRLAGTSAPSVKNVPAVATLRRGHCASSCDLTTNMPPMTFDAATKALTANLAGITVNTYTSGDIQRQLTNLSSTWNFEIPAGYAVGDVDIIVKLNDGHYTYFPPATNVPECASSIGWECQHNNTLVLHLHFQSTPTITVTTVLIRAGGSYTCPADGKTYSPTDPGAPAAARLPTTAQVTEIFRWLNMLFPMHVNQGAVSILDIDVATANKDNLLSAVTDRASDDDEFVLGILPIDPRCPANYGPNEKQSDGSYVAGYGGVGHNGAWADADNPSDAPHELAHNIGFEHWACENMPSDKMDDECGAFPIPHGGTDDIGTDIGAWKVILPGDNSSNSTPHEHDFMTYGQLCGLYGGGSGCDTGEWVSWYTYGILYGNTGIGDYDTDDPPALSIAGSISASGAVSFAPVYQTGISHPFTNLLNEDDAEQLYTLQGYDAKGNVVFVHNFEPTRFETHTSHRERTYRFRETVPVVPGLARIDLLKGTHVVGSLANPAPGATPTVSITAPSAGATWQAGSQQTIRWTSSSPAHLPLKALVQYSGDGGKTRITLARDFTGSALTVNTNDLPGGSSGTVYVSVTDGMNTAIAQVTPLTLQAKPPQVTISSPAPGMAYAAPIPVTYTAVAYDPQSAGTHGLTYSWSADNGTYHFTATGAQLTLYNALPPGDHTVTVSVTNAAGLTTKASVRVVVLTPTGKRVSGAGQSSGLPGWLIPLGIALVLIVLLVLLFLILRQRRKPAAKPVS